MGLFFDNRVPNPEFVDRLATAIQTQPSDIDIQAQAAALAGSLPPVVHAYSLALSTPAPTGPDATATAKAAATKAALSAADQLLGGPAFNTGRFVISFLIFAALLGGGIATEATHLTTASGTLFGFAGAIFGIVTAFLGTEKGSS